MSGKRTTAPKSKPAKLNERQRKFVEAYMASGNATDAARKAGYALRSARQTGARMLTNAAVREALAERQAADPAVMQREEFQQWLTRVIRGEERFEFMAWDGQAHELQHTPAAPKDRLKAGELLAKTNGWLIEKSELSGPGGGPIEVEAKNENVRALLKDPKTRGAAMALARAMAK